MCVFFNNKITLYKSNHYSWQDSINPQILYMLFDAKQIAVRLDDCLEVSCDQYISIFLKQ